MYVKQKNENWTYQEAKAKSNYSNGDTVAYNENYTEQSNYIGNINVDQSIY